MAGINAGPSQGFWSRMGQNLPGALNMAGSMMPGPFGQTARIAGALTRKPRQDGGGTNPDVQGKQTTVSNGPSGMPPTGPSPFTSGMVRMPNISLGPGGVMGPNGLPRNGNTGITGGMIPGGFGNINFGGGGNMMRPQPMPIGGDNNPGGGTGLWQMYNNLSTQAPQRQLFYQ